MQTEFPPENILILLADDMGVDKFAPYGVYPMQPATPNLDALTERGVLFRNAYAQPVCSPTRAALLTGRYATRTGVGRTIEGATALELHNSQTFLPEMLAFSPHDYETAAVGKWHLAGLHGESGLEHPLLNGFDWFVGSIGNLTSYDTWQRNDNGVQALSHTYATTDNIDMAIDRVEKMQEPWLLYIAFNAPHRPLTPPPESLHTLEGIDLDTPEPERYMAVVEAMDTEIGRLFDAIPPDVMSRTNILFLGDNGSGHFVITPPFDATRSKDSVFEGGIHVPFVVAGPRVAQPGSESDAFVHAVDVFHTVAEIGEVDLNAPDSPVAGVALDGISLVPYLSDPDTPSQRQYAFSEEFHPLGPGPHEGGARAIRNVGWKLMRYEGEKVGMQEYLYEMLEGALDEGPLIKPPYTEAQQAAFDELVAALDHLDAELVYDPRN